MFEEEVKKEMLNLEMWLSPTSLMSYQFLVEFEYTLKSFGDKVKFKPLYKFKNMKY